MGCGKRINFHRQWANLVKTSSVQTDTFIHDHVSDHFPFQVLIIFFCQFLVRVGDFLTQAGDNLFFQFTVRVAAFVFAAAGF